jgi:hypothetical protein
VQRRDFAGMALFGVGFMCEVVADLQKDNFRSNPANKAHFCNVGLWRYSRHPNFFGEIVLWLGIFMLATPVILASTVSWGWIAILSPIITFVILMLGSGMPTAEGDAQKRFMRTPQYVQQGRASSSSSPLRHRCTWLPSPSGPDPPPSWLRVPAGVCGLLCRAKAAFLEYRQRTSILIPLPPALYAALPLIVKRIALFEWPMYVPRAARQRHPRWHPRRAPSRRASCCRRHGARLCDVTHRERCRYETDWSYVGEGEGSSGTAGKVYEPPKAYQAGSHYEAASAGHLPVVDAYPTQSVRQRPTRR